MASRVDWGRPVTASRQLWIAFACLALLVVLLLQWLSADLTFVADDWLILSQRNLDLASLLTPFNEHLSIVPITILVILRDVIGPHGHGVYLLIVQLVHVIAAAGVLAAAVRYRSPVAALALAALALLMGPAAANFFWAFQLGTVSATAAGVWTLVLLDSPQPHRWVAAVLCAVAIASSSFGLPFAVAAGALGILRRDREAVTAIALVGAAYITWYVGFHFQGVGLCATPGAVDLVASSGAFMFSTLTYAVGTPIGIGLGTQAAISIAAVAAAGWLAALAVGIRSGDRPWLALVAVAGIVFAAVLIDWGRGCLGVQIAGASRYVYATGMLALVGVAASPRPRCVSMRFAPRATIAVALTCFIMAIGLNVRAIAEAHAGSLGSSRIVRAVVAVAFEPEGYACHTSPAHVDELTSDIAFVASPAWLRSWLGSVHMLDAPDWVGTDWQPSAALVDEVRHIMCETPPAPG